MEPWQTTRGSGDSAALFACILPPKEYEYEYDWKCQSLNCCIVFWRYPNLLSQSAECFPLIECCLIADYIKFLPSSAGWLVVYYANPRLHWRLPKPNSKQFSQPVARFYVHNKPTTMHPAKPLLSTSRFIWYCLIWLMLGWCRFPLRFWRFYYIYYIIGFCDSYSFLGANWCAISRASPSLL